jgi:hypothetical protein
MHGPQYKVPAVARPCRSKVEYVAIVRLEAASATPSNENTYG